MRFLLAPVYLSLLPEGSSPTADISEFLDLLALRLGMLKRGGVRDQTRAASWFVNWWRETGCTLSGSEPIVKPPPEGPGSQTQTITGGWGFDFQWTTDPTIAPEGNTDALIQRKMEDVIDTFVKATEEESREGGVSATQERKREKAAAAKKKLERVRNIRRSRD